MHKVSKSESFLAFWAVRASSQIGLNGELLAEEGMELGSQGRGLEGGDTIPRQVRIFEDSRDREKNMHIFWEVCEEAEWRCLHPKGTSHSFMARGWDLWLSYLLGNLDVLNGQLHILCWLHRLSDLSDARNPQVKDCFSFTVDSMGYCIFNDMGDCFDFGYNSYLFDGVMMSLNGLSSWEHITRVHNIQDLVNICKIRWYIDN